MQRIYEDYAYSDEARAECIWPLPDRAWPSVEGELTTEVAIVGGGYTGLSAALHLAQEGVSCTVLEAHVPGWGASGRNGGFCMGGGDKAGPSAIARRFGETAARTYFQTQKASVDLVAQILDTHGIDADTHSKGELLLAHRPQAVAALHQEADDWTSLGETPRFIPKSALCDEGMGGNFHAGLVLPLGFALNPGKYVSGLAEAADNAGADIYTNSPVKNIGQENGRYVLTTPKGLVTARKLIMATNGYSSDDLPNWLRGRYLPVQSNIIVTRPLTDDEIAQQGWHTDFMAYDSRNLLHYFRLLPDRRFLLGMRGNIAATPTKQDDMRARTARDLAQMFPAWKKVETPYFWSGLISMSRDLLPYIGPLGGLGNAWAGMNYHGNGVSVATWAGQQLARMAMGQPAGSDVHASPLARFPFAGLRRSYLRPAFWAYRLKDGPAP
ncbi:FAD-dependent oxidoreductase [Aliiroseovarius sp. KMU-50]|uniref:FAD-dependent oxidoreductase n=1 Tax=Aliiroseovarius salicola TaxID=3009082 RepID=A0ABT4W6X9_9RHOB|nr:FAD-binding oxidoreductase [Aliiroseovarius sp. KMU-50]MDA5095673.1 FAD-dependent oxidoreductase [Aliiroseovarius sp. KMU-50]